MPDRFERGLSRASPLTFSGAGLDRAAVERRDPDWLAARRAQPEARSLVLSDKGVWVENGRLLLVAPTADSLFLGLDDGRPLFALDATGAEPKRGRPAGLREAATELPAADAALGAYAASLLSWHRRHRYCANCGAPTEPSDGGHQRDCPSCHASHFPRTDPVVIVRVTDPADRLLLGRQARWPQGRFSVLAGFVEPGETLEEAVAREVLEESGVEVDDVAYVASQPWPFPSSLMVGFRARAIGGEPRPGDDELSEVRWFERSEVEAAAAGTGPVHLPPPYSISRRLIDEWRAIPAAPDTPRRSS
jgi:NAD+ diphosphatase